MAWSSKGEPQEKYYSAEVFPEGSEHDLRPDSDAIEYSGYCEAAGWKFLDGIRKFCVFERLRENAVPIITEEEKLANILKAEKQNWMLRYFPLFLFLVFYLPLCFFSTFRILPFSQLYYLSCLIFPVPHPFRRKRAFHTIMVSTGKKSIKRRTSHLLQKQTPLSPCTGTTAFICLVFPHRLLCNPGKFCEQSSSVCCCLFLTIPVFNLILSTFRPGRRQQMNIRMISALAVFILGITSIFFFNIPDSRRQIKVYRSMIFSFRQILPTQSQIRMLLLNIIIPKVFWEVKNPVPSGIPVPPTLIQYIILIIRFITRLISGLETFCGGNLQRITAVSHLSGRTALTTGPDWRR